MSSNKKDPKVAVITANFGGKDRMLKLDDYKRLFRSYNNLTVDFYYYTDYKNDYNYKFCHVVHPYWSDDKKYMFRRAAKYYKILHKPTPETGGEYDYFLWMDATHAPVAGIDTIIKEMKTSGGCEIMTFKHGRYFKGENHNCIYKEAKNIRASGGFLEHDNLIEQQMEYYQKKGFPPEYGMSNNSVILWRNTPKMDQLRLAWWEQICKWSSRDQLSLFYCHWQLGTGHLHGYFDGYWTNNKLVTKITGHENAEL